MTNLTPKQSRFVEEFLVDLNATAAAARAGYSKKTANEQGARLLQHPAVAAAIDRAKLARSIETGVDSRYVLRTLVQRAEADLAEIFNENGDLKEVADWPEVFRLGLVQSVEIDALFDGRGDDRVQIGHTKKVRLADRTRILELIGKHINVNAFQEIHQHRGFDGLAERLERAFNRIDSANPQTPQNQIGRKPTEGAEPLPSGRQDHPRLASDCPGRRPR